MTQAGLASAIGASQPAISQLEAGQYHPSSVTTRRIAEVLGEKLGREPRDVAGELVMAADLPPLQSDPSEHCTEAA